MTMSKVQEVSHYFMMQRIKRKRTTKLNRNGLATAIVIAFHSTLWLFMLLTTDPGVAEIIRDYSDQIMNQNYADIFTSLVRSWQ